MIKQSIFLRVALSAALTCVAAVAVSQNSQETYDPMRPAANMLTPNVTPSTTTPKLDPELGNLPIGQGAEATYYQCIACHSTAIIRQQRLTDERWDYLWTWMVDEQGMYEPDADQKAEILTYLKTHFSSER